jgi:hypothetical protein
MQMNKLGEAFVFQKFGMLEKRKKNGVRIRGTQLRGEISSQKGR